MQGVQILEADAVVSCDMPQADQVRGKLREFIARRRQPGTDGIAMGNKVLPVTS